MTDKPATLSLGPREWRSLITTNLTDAAQFVHQNDVLGPENLTLFLDHMNRIKAMISAWHLSTPAVAADKAAAEPAPKSETKAATNGAAPAKRKGGWPRGKPRKQVQQVVQ